MRAIDADALFEPNESTDKVLILGRSGGKTIALAERMMRQRVNMAPTLTLDDLRPKGRWNVAEINKVINRITIECPFCNMVAEMPLHQYKLVQNYCSYCGADMRGGGEDA